MIEHIQETQYEKINIMQFLFTASGFVIAVITQPCLFRPVVAVEAYAVLLALAADLGGLSMAFDKTHAVAPSLVVIFLLFALVLSALVAGPVKLGLAALVAHQLVVASFLTTPATGNADKAPAPAAVLGCHAPVVVLKQGAVLCLFLLSAKLSKVSLFCFFLLYLFIPICI